MTCNSCGEKPKNTAKDFTKAVIEINNPETLVLLRKVVIPASMGTEEQVPPAIGKYHNVILYYEANKHVYLYSSDGIPTLLEMDIPQELLDRIEDLEDGLSALEEEFEEFKNSPDVVDIVATYADLQSYDTSSLGDKDIVRVLSDETHGGASTYYRWIKNDSQWEYIGTFGDSITVLSEEDYDYPEYNPAGVALWRLPDGIYHNPRLVNVYTNSTSHFSASSYYIKVSGGPNNATQIYVFDGGGETIRIYWVNPADGSCNDTNKVFLKSTDCIDWLNSTATNRPLSANQGYVLDGKITTLQNSKQDALTAGDDIDITNNIIKATNTGKIRVLSSDDYNYPTTGTKYRVNAWELEPGIYSAPDGVRVAGDSTAMAAMTDGVTVIVGAPEPNNKVHILMISHKKNDSHFPGVARSEIVDKSTGAFSEAENYLGVKDVLDNLTSTSDWNPLSANQGRLLNNHIGDITTLHTADKSSTVAAINEIFSGLTPVVQTTGVSTTDVMSQNATTSMAYSDPATKYHIVLGDGATNTGGGDGSVAIGRNAHAHGDTVSIGTDSGSNLADANHQINIGHGAGNEASHGRSISIGDYSKADHIGAIAIGSGPNTSGNTRATKMSAVAIGVGATANGERSVALGNGAIVDSTGTRSISLEGQAYARGAVALGAGSTANIEGTVDVGAAWHMSDETWGYLGSDYRRITGVYDGQALHDAATLAQGNTLSDSAPTTATVGVLGQLYTDTTNMHTYQCTYIDDSDPNNPPLYTWTQRW